MMQCQQCQPLILDHLYGLLEEPESVAVESHLRECAACAAVRDEAARVQGLIARAAKGAFPQVRFDPPIAKPTPLPATQAATNISWPLPLPTTTAAEPVPTPANPSSAQTVRAIPYLAWAIAASVLLAIPGTVIPVLGVLNRADSARKATDDSIAIATAATTQTEKAAEVAYQRRAEAADKLVIAKQIQERLLAKWVDEEKAVAQTQEARKMTVDVLKPATAQPGAPNEFLLVLHDRGLAQHTQLLAEVRDQTDAVIFSQRLDPERKDNRHVLRLPAETWTKLTPQSELFLVVSSEDDKTHAKTELQEKVRLFGPVYTTMLVTDRPTYRPGEMLYFRSLTLDRIALQPPSREQALLYELRGPHQHPVFHRALSGGTDLVRVQEAKVDPVLGPDGKPLRGVGCGAFFLPPDMPDGDYTLHLRELPHPAGYPVAIPYPVTRSIKVRSEAANVYAKMIGYEAASYSAGETVQAWAELKFQGQPVSGAEAAVVAVVDNKQVKVLAAPATGPDGRTSIRFALPDNINQADVRLKVTFKTKTGDESIAERVPVIGHNLIVEFFPEGGPLVAGVPCRVYVRATTPTGQPADIRGTITDGRAVLARIETLTDSAQPGANRGIGSFTYTPTLGTPVWLKLESPSGAFAPLLDGPLPIAPAVVAGAPAAIAARSGFSLPEPKAEGVVMSVVNPVTKPNEPIRVHLQSAGEPRNLIVGAYTRGRLSDTKRVRTQPRQLAVVDLMANADPRGGVVRITVFEEPPEQTDAVGATKPDITPIAERLVFRKPGESLQLAFTTTGTSNGATEATFAANSSLDMALTATDEKGKPTAAVLWAAAVNTGVAPGKKDRLATTHFLLAGEVSTPDAMEYADFLLTDLPKAAESLDLVLATQGWRRFVEQTPLAFAPHRIMANMDRPTVEQTKLLVCNGQYQTLAEPPGVREQRKLKEAYLPRYETATKALVAAQAAHDSAIAETSDDNRIRELATVADQAQREAKAAAERAKTAAEPVERLRGSGWYGIAGFGLLAVMLGALALARPLSRLPYGIGTAGSVGLVAFLVVALGMAEQTQAAIQANEEFAKNSLEPWPVLHARAGTTIAEDFSDHTVNKTQAQSKTMGIQASAAGKATPAPHGTFGGNPGGAQAAPMAGASKMNSGFLPPPGAIAQGGFPGVAGNDGLAGPPEGRPGGGFGGGAARLGAGAIPDGKGPAAPGGIGPFFAKEGNSNERKVIPDWELPQTRDTFPRLLALGRRLDEGFAETEALKRTTDKAKAYADDRASLLRAPLEKVLQAESQSKVSGVQAAMKIAEPGQTLEMMAYKRVKAAVPTIPPLVVREYAAPRPGTEGADSEMSDTILWQPVIVLPGDGKATLRFQLGAAKGGYQVVIAGHTLDGRIGAVRGLIAVTPQSVPPTTPALPAPIPPTMP
jgi:hypothetical protein